MRDVMVDLETCGVRAGCAILSIGAVVFDHTKDKLGREFYQVINLQSCLDAGLHVFGPTMDWWESQSDEARKVLTLAKSKRSKKVLPLLEALSKFNDFLGEVKSPKVYGNGADFDNSILISAYCSVGLKQGWGPYMGGCYRTLKRDVMPEVKVDRVGVHHHALDDAKHQAKHQIQIMRRLDEMKALWVKNQG